MIGEDLDSGKRGGETKRHRLLKRLSEEWLRERGCRAVAKEVRVPLSPYRADVAAYRSSGRMGVMGESFIVECKQSRADFLRDAGLGKTTERERCKVRSEVEQLRALLAVHLPDCRLGLSLFREYDQYDFGDLRHERWRRLLARLGCLERRLAEGVKFSKLARYGAANRCILVVEAGVLACESELPPAWGCLLREGSHLELLREPVALRSSSAAKLALLERIAARASR